MTKYTAILISILSAYLNVKVKATSIDSVAVTFMEEAADSSGPWNLAWQEIDSLDQNGMVQSETRRARNGGNWVNERNDRFKYNQSGKLTEHINSSWDGSSFREQVKKENIYDVNGNLETEIHYTFVQNNWIPENKTEYSYSGITQDSLIVSSNYSGGVWTYTNQHILTYNSNEDLISDLWKTWNGTSWNTLRISKRSYSPSTLKIQSDSVFNFAAPHFLLYQTSHYNYNTSGNLESKIKNDFYSYLYSDPDTEYIVSEIDFAYTEFFTYDTHGKIAESHGEQTYGSAHARVFSHKYYQYNAAGILTNYFSHQGSNITESFSKNSSYYYTLLDYDYISTGVSCIGCMNGTVQLNVSGGIPPYQIQINAGSANINGMQIDNLASGTYQICVTDSIGNEKCRDILVQDTETGVENEFPSKKNNLTEVKAGLSGFTVECNSQIALSFYVYDGNGRILIQKNLKTGKSYIPTNDLPAGIYFYRAVNSEVNLTGKIAWLD